MSKQIREMWKYPSEIMFVKATIESPVLSVGFHPLRWNYSIPPGINVNEWRRTQLSKYITQFPTHKPMTIMNWLSEHEPHPWPDCTRNSIKSHIMRWKNSPGCNNLKAIGSENLDPVSIKWDTKRSSEFSLSSWRRMQLRRFLSIYPGAKPRHLMKWIASHTPNP